VPAISVSSATVSSAAPAPIAPAIDRPNPCSPNTICGARMTPACARATRSWNSGSSKAARSAAQVTSRIWSSAGTVTRHLAMFEIEPGQPVAGGDAHLHTALVDRTLEPADRGRAGGIDAGGKLREDPYPVAAQRE
jgi:hypothetical protein